MYLPPPLLFLLAVAVSYGISIMFPGLQYYGLSVSWMGLVLVSVGALAIAWGRSTLIRHKTTLHPKGKPSRLVTRGPYSLTRNPIYLGFFLTALGTAMLFANVLAFAGPLLFFAFVSLFIIPFEEQVLARKFGKSYHAYRKKTRRWI